MNTLDEFLADRQSGPALDLLLQTTAAVRADADFVRRPDDAVGGVALSEESPVSLNANSLDAVMAQIDRSAALDESAARQAVKGGRAAEVAALPSPLREAALAAMAREPWRFGGFGIRRLTLMADAAEHGGGRDEGAFVELMRIEPGRGVPDHDHADDELTLILTGAYHDGHHHYRPGDISLARPGFSHTPSADPGEVCYVLAISYGAPRLGGVYRLLQPFLAEPADARAVWRTR